MRCWCMSRRLCGFIVERLEHVHCHVRHRCAEPQSHNHNGSSPRRQIMSNSCSPASVQRGRVPCRLPGGLVGRVDKVHALVRWWRSGAHPSDGAPVLWRRGVPCGRGIPGMQLAQLPRGLRCVGLGGLGGMQQDVRYRQSDARPHHYSGARVRRQGMLAAIEKPGLHGRCVPGALRCIGVVGMEQVHRKLRHWCAEPQSQRACARRARGLRLPTACREQVLCRGCVSGRLRHIDLGAVVYMHN